MRSVIFLHPSSILAQVVVAKYEGSHQRFESGFSSMLDRFRKTAQGGAYHQCIK